jgi:hypothetical protein
MSDNIKTDFAGMEKKLKFYIDKGRVTGAVEVKEEPVISIKPDASLIKPLKKVSGFLGGFVAVDCSTRTLKRANNWGIYLMRAAYASVKERDVDWGYKERICTAVGDVHVRRSFLQDFRIEMESQIALNLLSDNALKRWTYMRMYAARTCCLMGVAILVGKGNFEYRFMKNVKRMELTFLL